MRISFLVNEVVGGWEPTDNFLGGTEESVVRWAEELARRGNEVRIFRNGCKTESEFTLKEVIYQDREHFYSGFGDVVINIKSFKVTPNKEKGFNVPMFYLTNETNAT